MATNKNIPPRLADKFLNWFCKSELIEGIQGDLHESYERLDTKNWKTRLNYWMQVFKLMKPFVFKKTKLTHNNYTAMFRFNLLITFRNMMRYKLFACLNVLGLTLGLTSAIFIGLYVLDELSYDTHHPDYERIFRIHNDHVYKKEEANAQTVMPLDEFLKQQWPEIEATGRVLMNSYNKGLTYKNRTIMIQQWLAEQGILDVFNFETVYGQLEGALDAPRSVVITESISKLLFGEINPVGLSIIPEYADPVTIRCVIKDLPKNSHFHPDILISMNVLNSQYLNRLKSNWNVYYGSLYLKMNNSNPKKILSPLDEILKEKYKSEGELEWDNVQMKLTNVADIHLTSHLGGEFEVNGDMKQIRLFILIGAVILLLAGINFINLTTAKASNRLKEIAVKKINGSNRRLLVGQFLLESIFYSLLAMVIAIIIAYFLLPYFNHLSGKSFDSPLFNGYSLALYLLLITFFLGIVAGTYPAWVISGTSPIQTLTGGKANSGSKPFLRSTLIATQFAISTVLIFSLLVGGQQMNFIENKSLGFDASRICVLDGFSYGDTATLLLKKQLLQLPQVENVALTKNSRAKNFYSFAHYKAQENEMIPYQRVNFVESENGIENVLDLQLTRGNFDLHPRDSSRLASIVLNETAVKALKLTDPIGKVIESSNGWKQKIVGVVEDIHFQSLHKEISPTGFIYSSRYRNMYIRYRSNNLVGFLDDVEAVWREYKPSQVIDYRFLDEEYQQLYEADLRTNELFKVFTSIAIIIACLGIYGLAAFSATQRKKEIGIRKVLGASVGGLIVMLARNISKPILLAVIIGLPIGYLMMNNWLENFAYRIEIDWTLLLLTALVPIIIGLSTICLTSLKPAQANPADNLKYE